MLALYENVGFFCPQHFAVILPSSAADCRSLHFSSRGHNKPFSMGGDHGHSKMSMPDWRQWKVEGTPLEFTQQRLAARGLKDPWARNEAWRYSGGFARAVTLSEVLFRGFKWGFAAFTVALAIEYTMFPPKKGGH